MKEFNYLKTKKKYLDSMGRTKNSCDDVKCDLCMLSSRNNGRAIACTIFEMRFPEEATKIMEDWAEKHQIVTNKEMFEKIFNKNIHICPSECTLYKVDKTPICATFRDNYKPCDDCYWWEKEYKEPQEQEDK